METCCIHTWFDRICWISYVACTTPDVMPLRGLWRVTQSARGGCTHQHILQPFGKQYILNIYSKFHSNTLPISAPLAPLVTGRGSRSASPVARMKTSPRSIPIVRRGIVLRVSLITFPPPAVSKPSLCYSAHTPSLHTDLALRAHAYCHSRSYAF